MAEKQKRPRMKKRDRPEADSLCATCKARGNERICKACKADRGKATADALFKAVGIQTVDVTPDKPDRYGNTKPIKYSPAALKRIMADAERGVTFTVPGKPVGKGRPRFTRTGICYTPEKTRRYEELVRLSFAAAGIGFKPIEGPVSLMISAYFPIPKKGHKAGDWFTGRPDDDNIKKIVQDALNGMAYKDDAQVCRSGVTKKYSETPEVVVTVGPVRVDGISQV